MRFRVSDTSSANAEYSYTAYRIESSHPVAFLGYFVNAGAGLAANKYARFGIESGVQTSISAEKIIYMSNVSDSQWTLLWGYRLDDYLELDETVTFYTELPANAFAAPTVVYWDIFLQDREPIILKGQTTGGLRSV